MFLVRSYIRTVLDSEGAVRTVPLWPGTGVRAPEGVTAPREQALDGVRSPSGVRCEGEAGVWSTERFAGTRLRRWIGRMG